MAKEKSLRVWFTELCDERRPLWESRIAEHTGDQAGAEQRADLGARFARNAREDLKHNDFEISQMLVCTTIIVAAATLLFAVYAFKGNLKAPAIFLALALCFAAIAFVAALVPMAPPFMRAWRQPYEKRHNWTLLVHDDFTSWVLDCWLTDRRTSVITKYKRAHSVAVPTLVCAAVIMAVGLVLNLFQ